MAATDIENQPGMQTNKLGSFQENESFDISPESSIGETTEWFSMFKTAARAVHAGQATQGMVDPESGVQLAPPEEDVDPKALQEKYPQLPGKPAFEKAMPDSVAQDIYSHQLDEIRIAEAKARRPDGFWHGAAEIGAQFAADALDPLNIAAMFIPVVGEGRFVAEGASLGARIAARTAAGAINADVGQIPLVALRYAQSRAEQDDYNAYNAMSDLATGAAMGGLLHIGVGAIADRLGARMAASNVPNALENDPALRESAMRTAAAQALTDAPTEVRPVFDAAGLHAATAQRDAFLEEAANIPDLHPDSPAAHRIQEIDEELGGGQRLAAIDAELNTAISPTRRATLEAERGMVEANKTPLERVGALMKEREHIIALEQARGEAARSGLMEAAGRSEAEITSHLQAKHAEDYATLEAMAKEAGTDVHAAYLATATIGDAKLEDLERAYQQTRAADAASKGAGRGQQPGVPGPGAAAGAEGAGQVGGATEPAAAGAGGAPGAGPGGAAGPAAGVGAGAADTTGLIAGFRNAGQAIGDNLRNMLWDSFSKGQTTEAGMRSPTLEAAQIAKQEGKIKNRADFDKFINDRAAAQIATRQQTAAQAAQRAAEGVPSADAQAVTREAQAAAKVAPTEAAKATAAALEDHEAFFKAAEAAGVLTDADRLHLEEIKATDEQASSLTKAGLQAAACIARGLTNA